MNKKKVKAEAIKFISMFGENIKTKFTNICGKTGSYDVPLELFQKRTSRTNRVLISWKTVKKNNLTIEQLETFDGGVVVEFINDDYFNNENITNPTFLELKKRIGCNDNVSSMISFRNEGGGSSSKTQRIYFEQFLQNSTIRYNNQDIVINEHNYKNYLIHRISPANGKGNSAWTGFLFVCIKGGQQDTIETHKNKNELLFNPACEYANEDICLDIDLVELYFAMKSIKEEQYFSKKDEYKNILREIEDNLKESEYDNVSYTGNLLDYCKNHPCLKMGRGEVLYDPIQVAEINITDFGIKNKDDPRNLDFSHDEAVLYEKYYWDNKKNCLLTPCRPTNISWLKHLSNMMQQNFTLDEFFKNEEALVMRRKELLK